MDIVLKMYNDEWSSDVRLKKWQSKLLWCLN